MVSSAVVALERAGYPAQPADHLVPPPLPQHPQHPSHPPPALPTPQRLTHATAGLGSVPVAAGPSSVGPEPGFMTRVARWFGLGGATSGKDQQQSPSNSLSYVYPKPGQSFEGSGGKPCSLCNKYPWVPMVGHQQQQQQQQPLQVQQQQLWHLQHQQPVAQASQQRQRAVQFQGPPPQLPNFLPLAVPLPPLYKAQPFRPPLPNENVVSESVAVAVAGPGAGPLATPPPSTSTFEIVKSHQVTDFVTSVEYPATFVQSHAIDLGSATSQQVLPDPSEPSTVRYQLEDLASGQVHQHLPASQLLTELGHFVETTTVLPPPPADNYPAASSQLQHLQQEQEQDHEQEHEQEHEQGLYYAEQEETSTLIYGPTTAEPPTTTMAPQPPAQAIELNNHLVAGMPNHRQGISRGRETPKRLLDSPINHAGGRPFTRDPADLNFRLSQAYTPTQPPTPTSTYGAIDASGQYAGMSPPSPKQVIIPYTTRQRPRPFESWTPLRHHQSGNDLEEEPHEQQESKLATATVTAPNTRRTTKYLTKILASNLRELLKRERETKGLPGQGLGVDLSKLQRNIDGWTEQEYNSLSHRPSTPTIRGRSKHIPTEYLTTTTTTTTTPAPQRQSKTTRGEGFELGGAPPTVIGDLSTSINNLEQLHLLGERGSKRFQHLDDNRLSFDYSDARPRPTQAMATTTSSTSTTAPPTTSTTTTTEVTPLYVRSTTPPKELWKQLQVAILPQTNEKVYVVTPQPATAPPRHKTDHHEAEASAPRPVYQAPAPRLPRMRHTPGTPLIFVIKEQ